MEVDPVVAIDVQSGERGKGKTSFRPPRRQIGSSNSETTPHLVSVGRLSHVTNGAEVAALLKATFFSPSALSGAVWHIAGHLSLGSIKTQDVMCKESFSLSEDPSSGL